jgi:hypothetical protein
VKISRQLKLGDLNKAGYAPIQLTVSWAGLRVREATGELTKPDGHEQGGRRQRLAISIYHRI